MSKKKQSSSPQPLKPTQPPTEATKTFAAPLAPEKPKVKDLLVVNIESDGEILSKVPTLAKECKMLQFTSSEKCMSMEKWQILFEQNGFKFVCDLHNPSIRTQLYQSLQ